MGFYLVKAKEAIFVDESLKIQTFKEIGKTLITTNITSGNSKIYYVVYESDNEQDCLNYLSYLFQLLKSAKTGLPVVFHSDLMKSIEIKQSK